MQEFDTIDVLSLEVQGDPAPGAVSNLVKNPYGGGGWGWLSPVPNTRLTAESDGLLDIKTTAAQPVYVESEIGRIPAGATHVAGSLTRQAGTSNLVGVRIRAVFYDADYQLVGSSAQSPLVTADLTPTNLGAQAIPGGSVYAALRVDVYRSGGNPNAGDLASTTHAILVAGTLAQVTSPTITLDDGWVDILGPTHQLTIERDELDLGTLTADIFDATLDPSVSETIRKGKAVRVVGTGATGVLFTGEVLRATVEYRVQETNPDKVAHITLTAVDRVKTLSEIKRPTGVGTILELAYLLEGAGIPWNLDGQTGHTSTVPLTVSSNGDASLLDQVAITRDSVLGYAWVDRAGSLQVWSAGNIGAEHAIGPTVDETIYSGVTIDFDTDRCINYLTVKYLRLDPVTGETEEVTYGPYRDQGSIDKWGLHTPTNDFTVHGLVEDETTIAAYAEAILSANATPTRRVLEVAVPIRTTDDLETLAVADLYDLTLVENAQAGLSDLLRVTRVAHQITGTKWTMTLGFAADGGVAQPQAVPSPGLAGGKTLVELLRPIGEVTMWFGALGEVPDGWLALVGGVFDEDVYPNLFAHLGTNALPDMTDVFPIGAGTKALGTSGGSPTKTLAAANLPPHTHPLTSRSGATAFGAASAIARPSATGTLDAVGTLNTGGNASGTGGNPNPFDVMPPWRAVYFIIRAR